ncbi:MAG: hypothetical protein K8S54_09170 [Spirochaetia bacterium]|nr:hypothetical protein [Spirochaetia bacterium]
MNFVTKKQSAIISFSSTDLEATVPALAQHLSELILPESGEVVLRAPTGLDIAWEPFTAIFQFAQRAQKSGMKVSWSFPDNIMSDLAQIGFEKAGD